MSFPPLNICPSRREPPERAAAAPTPEDAPALSGAEVARLERLFRDRLANGILCQAQLEWQEFDIEAFLQLIETSDLEAVCRKAAASGDAGPGPGPAEQREADRAKKARDRERQRAYERMRCEMRLLAEVLKALGAPAEDIKVTGLVGVIKDARDADRAKFDGRVYRRRPEPAVAYAYPDVLRANRDLVFEGGARLAACEAGRTAEIGPRAAGSRGAASGDGGLGVDAPGVEDDFESGWISRGRVAPIRLLDDEKSV